MTNDKHSTISIFMLKQESPADADRPARRKRMLKITPFGCVGNPVFIVIKFLIQITSTYSS